MPRARTTLEELVKQQFRLIMFLIISIVMLSVLICQIIELLETMKPGLMMLKALMINLDPQMFHERMSLIQNLAYRSHRNITM